jgi:hypothetical protein
MVAIGVALGKIFEIDRENSGFWRKQPLVNNVIW